MCGIHGIITNSKRENNGDDYIKSSFVAGSLRGMDSSGIASIDTKARQYELHKLPVTGSMFITDKVAQRLIRDASKPEVLTICHTRAATVGEVSINTAHPFECETDDGMNSLIGVHNGTLTNWKSKKNARYYDVDSEWALNHILTEGKDAFKDFAGAFCFVWWGGEDYTTLNIARNKERPMHIALLENGGVAYASEAGMLYWLLERHNVRMQGNILELQEGFHYKFPVENPHAYTKEKLVAAQTTTHTSTTRSTYKSAMEKVRELFRKTEIPSAPAPFSERVATVTDEERDNARDLGVLGSRVEFNPWINNSTSVDGVATVLDSEIEATVLSDSYLPFDQGETWHCVVLGLADDNSGNYHAILGKPIMKERRKTEAA